MPAPAIDSRELARVADAIRSADCVLAVTGAGISADSGLPTYRGIGGLYDQEHTTEGLPIEQLLSGPMLRQRPELCWKYIAEIEAAARGAQPNAGHHALARLEEQLDGFWVLTQNVDGLHAAAGSRRLIEMHGNIHRLHCVACGWEERVADFSGLTLPPACPECASLVRPAVVLFEEMLPAGAVAQYEVLMQREPDVVLSIGTTSVFPYIAAPVMQAGRSGGLSVEINPGESEVSGCVDIRWACRAGEALPQLAAAVQVAG